MCLTSHKVPGAANARSRKHSVIVSGFPAATGDLAHYLVVLSGVHRFAICVAAARSASPNGRPLRAGRGTGSKHTVRGGQSPVSTSCLRCLIGSVRFGNGR